MILSFAKLGPVATNRGAACVIFLALLVSGCKETPSGGAGAQPSASAATPVAPSARSFMVPSGPPLAILAGQGVGPIRIGANTATIERLMEAPCDERSSTLCRYVSRAVEFELDESGNTAKIRVHRMERPAGEGKKYGIFNGAIPPDIRFGMLPTAVIPIVGPAERTEDGDKGAFPGTVAQHHYKGMVLEYDQLPNGKIVLGGVRIPN